MLLLKGTFRCPVA